MDETDEEIWASFRRSYPRPGRASRGAHREERAAQHIQRHRERGAQPRGRDRGLSRDEIVRAAIAIADAEGPDAISMRRIARELRAGAMSLYWHVGSKEELLDLMLDSLYAANEVPEPSGDWRADLRAFACGNRAVMLRHPWAMDFIGGRPPSGPNDAQNAEQLLALLDGLDLDAELTMNILMTVMTYVMGAALREAQEIRGDRDWEQAMAGRTAAEIEADRQRFQAWFEASGRYPHILCLMKEDYDPDAAETRDERFEFGLDCVLDGVAARVQKTPPRSPAQADKSRSTRSPTHADK